MGESVYPTYAYTEDYQSNPPSSCANSSYQGSPVPMYTMSTEQIRISPTSSGYSTPITQHLINHEINYHEGERELHESLQSRFPFLTGQRKRSRKLLTTEQTAVLESILEKTVYPSTPLREAIAHELGIPPRKVQIWFQNKRQSRRKSPNDLVASPLEACCNTPMSKSQSNTRSMNSADYQKLFHELHNIGMPKTISPPRQSDYQNGGYVNANHRLPPPRSAHPSMNRMGAMPNRPPFRPRTQSELGSIQEARATVATAVAAMHHERAQQQHRQMQARAASSGTRSIEAVAASSNLACLNMAAQRYMNDAVNHYTTRSVPPPFWPKPTKGMINNRSSGSMNRPRPSPLSLDAHSLKNSANVVAINSSSDDWTLDTATTCDSSAMTPTFPGDVLGRQHIEAGGRLFTPIKSIEKPINGQIQLAPIEITPGLNARHETLPRIAELMRT